MRRQSIPFIVLDSEDVGSFIEVLQAEDAGELWTRSSPYNLDEAVSSRREAVSGR